MKTLGKVAFCLLVGCLLVLGGCGKKADETKPLSDVKAEADSMSVEKLRSMAVTYKDAITAKKGEIAKVADKLKDIPVAKMLGDEAKGLKTDIDSLTKSASALKERFQVYYDKLKEKGGDLSGLTI
jgi:hypothetical protein